MQKTSFFFLNNDKVSSTSFSSTLSVQALLPESWYRCVHTLSTRYVTVNTLHRFRLVGSVAGSEPVLTTKQKTCAHTGTVPVFWRGCLNGCVHINTQRIPYLRAWALNVKAGFYNCQLICVVTMLGNSQGLIKHKGKYMLRPNCLSFLQVARKPAK